MINFFCRWNNMYIQNLIKINFNKYNQNKKLITNKLIKVLFVNSPFSLTSCMNFNCHFEFNIFIFNKWEINF